LVYQKDHVPFELIDSSAMLRSPSPVLRLPWWLATH
jgi:hypothetical protein